MLTEALNELLTGDIDLEKAILRDYINATISFDIFHIIQKLGKVKIKVFLK